MLIKHSYVSQAKIMKIVSNLIMRYNSNNNEQFIYILDTNTKVFINKANSWPWMSEACGSILILIRTNQPDMDYI